MDRCAIGCVIKEDGRKSLIQMLVEPTRNGGAVGMHISRHRNVDELYASWSGSAPFKTLEGR